jgi:two-component sensor histidine kinase/putative methionine-R-sulfoxide reductase with GAF domain
MRPNLEILSPQGLDHDDPPPADPQRALGYLSLITQVAGDLLEARDSAGMVDDLFAMIQTQLGLDVFFNYRLEDDGLVLETSGGLTAEQRRDGDRLQLGQAVCGCAAQRRKAIHATSIQNSNDPLVAFVKAVGLSAYACTPLIYGETLIGTLGFGRRQGAQFDDDELNFLHTVCHYVALMKHRLLVEAQLREALTAKEHLFQELNHRVRNSLQLVSGIIAAESAEASGAVREALTQAGDRIQVIAMVHQRLYERGSAGGVEIGGLLRDLAADLLSLDGEPATIEIEQDGAYWLEVEKGVALALAFDELVRARLAALAPRNAPPEGENLMKLTLSRAGETEFLITLKTRPNPNGVAPTAGRRVVTALLRQLRAKVAHLGDPAVDLALLIPIGAVKGAP